MKRKKRKNEDGFSLLEAMIAVVVLAVGLLAIGTMQVTAIQGNTSARVMSEGSGRAGEILESLLSLNYADPLLTDQDDDGAGGLDDWLDEGSGTVTADRFLDKSTFPDLGNYVIYWNIADNQIMEDTKTLSVIVVWPEDGLNRKIALRRVIPRVK